MGITIWKPTAAGTGIAMAPGQQAMKAGYSVAAQVMHDVMAKNDPAALARWQALQQSQTIQVATLHGKYDQMQHQMQNLGIPHAQASLGSDIEQLFTQQPDLKALYINCGCKISRADVRRVVAFVEAGGLLTTTDWALKNVIEVGFPGMIRWNRKKTGNEFVNIDQIASGTGGALSVIQNAAGQQAWWLEVQSYPIQILDPQRVQVLMFSTELQQRWGTGAVKVKFPWGKGWVTHMISHAHLQQQKQDPNFDDGKTEVEKVDDLATDMGVSAATAQVLRNATERGATGRSVRTAVFSSTEFFSDLAGIAGVQAPEPSLSGVKPSDESDGGNTPDDSGTSKESG